MKTRFLMGVMLSLLLLSCSTSKENDLAYFNNLGASTQGELPEGLAYDIRIQPDDELIISVTSEVPEASAKYNVPTINYSRRSAIEVTSTPQQQTYVVDANGNIIFPVLGKLQVAGKTTAEVASMITNQVSSQVKDPYVRVQLATFAVNVMGEVKEPKRVNVTGKRFSLLDALASCGDLTEYAERDNVLVIRNENGKRTYHRLNLADSQVFSDPYFYLQQNDVVYVTPNAIRVDNSKYNQNNSYKLTVISTIVSAASVVASLVIALAVK